LCAAALAAAMACLANGCSLHSSCSRSPLTAACTATVGAAGGRVQHAVG
jgi:hypothetical protein